MNIKTFKKGDIAYLLQHRHDDLEEVKIDSVGRIYVHIGSSRFQPHYYPECLRNSCIDDLLFKSINDYEDYKEHIKLEKELRNAFDRLEMRKISLSKLRKIKEILEGDNET